MKIVHVIDYFQPKLGYQETYLARAHANLGHDVYVVTSDRYAPSLYPAAKGILGNRIKSTGYFMEEGIKVWRLPAILEFLGRVWIWGLKKKLLELNPDVIIIHSIANIASIQVSSLRDKLPNAKIIFDDHMVFTASRKWLKFAYIPIKLLFSRKILSSADALVAVSEATKKFMNRIYGLPFNKISVIPLGCDTSLFHRDSHVRSKLRKRYKILDDDVVFIYAGKLIPSKGVHILIQAAISLLKTHSNVKVMIVGNGNPNYVEALKNRISLSGFATNFKMIPMVSNKDLYKIYSVADVGVWPKQCSLTMLEAMACELPVIISDNSETTERVSCNNGLIYREGDIDDLKEKMRLMLDPKIRKVMGKNARKFVEKLDWRVIAQKFLEVGVTD